MIAILILLDAHIYKTRFESMKLTYLAYLRGLEIAELKEEDMPMV